MPTNRELTEEIKKLKQQIREMKAEEVKLAETLNSDGLKCFGLVELNNNHYQMLDFVVDLENKKADIVKVQDLKDGRPKALNTIKRRIANVYIMRTEV